MTYLVTVPAGRLYQVPVYLQTIRPFLWTTEPDNAIEFVNKANADLVVSLTVQPAIVMSKENT